MNYLEKENLKQKNSNLIYQKETLELKRMFLVIKELDIKLKKDGNQWCYIYGELPESNCIAGFGDTPVKALKDFYYQWSK
jgi:hypothetical protein